MAVRRSNRIVVRRAPGNRRHALICLAHGVKRASLGRAGTAALKREGDGATPVGTFGLRYVLYRADRAMRPRTRLPVRAIRRDDAWCEDAGDRNYNRLVKASAQPRIDRLMRADHLYDLVVVLGHNDRPRVKGRGSAIFIHLARPGYTPTEGCIALARRDLDMLLRQARLGTRIVVMS
jgi:L,D-peptidoglycan transpeptidase YkuD (ErfK/YbiS/YcfS/YnhG family)